MQSCPYCLITGTPQSFLRQKKERMRVTGLDRRVGAGWGRWLIAQVCVIFPPRHPLHSTCICVLPSTHTWLHHWRFIQWLLSDHRQRYEAPAVKEVNWFCVSFPLYVCCAPTSPPGNQERNILHLLFPSPFTQWATPHQWLMGASMGELLHKVPPSGARASAWPF